MKAQGFSLAAGLLSLYLLVPWRAEAAPAAVGFTPPQDDRRDWVVGFCVLSPVDVSPRNLYLIYSIPFLLEERLIAAQSHLYSAPERESCRKELIRRRIRKYSSLLLKKRRERDELFARSFRGGDFERQIKKKQEQIQRLLKM